MITVRSLATVDHSAVREIDIAAEREYQGEAWDRLPAEEQERALISNAEEFPISVASGFSLVATEGEKVVGFVFAFKEPLPHDRLYVWQVTVAAEHRRTGVGSALYAELIERARAAGMKDIRANINLDNKRSQRFHESAGFKLSCRFQATLEL